MLLSQVVYYPSLSLRISSRSQFLKPLNSLCSVPSSSFEIRLFYLPQRRIAINFVPPFPPLSSHSSFFVVFICCITMWEETRKEGWITDDAMPRSVAVELDKKSGGGGAPLPLDVSQWKRNRVICSRQVNKKTPLQKVTIQSIWKFSEVNPFFHSLPTVFPIRPGTPRTCSSSARARAAMSLLLSSSPSAPPRFLNGLMH